MRKRIAALLLAFVMMFSLLPVSALAADHSVTYVTEAVVKDEKGNNTSYTNVVKNWGTRGELATYLSPMAEEFYEDTTYSSLSQFSAGQLQSLMTGTIPSYDDSKYLLTYTDCEENGYYISDFYTGVDILPVWDGGATWNREHTWPQSKFSGGDTDDIILLRPVTSTVNSSRGNAAYGESNAYFKPNSLTDEFDIRGDVARGMIYGRIRWGMTNMYGTSGVIESEEVLLSWMEADPVDTWEMGRNDVIQSITGVRNVFVDYPELAFVVLGEEVPDTMQTPTGSVMSNDFDIVALSNNEAYGTVHVNGNTVTAMPKAGYEAVGYVILAGEATVTRNYDVFTVIGDCTIRIQFAEQTPGTVNYNQKGVVATTATYTPGEMIFMPEYKGTVPSGYQFVGWVTDPLSDTDTRPSGVLRPGDPYKVESGINDIYALYSYMDMSVGGEQWQLVTSNSQLAVDDRVVIAAHGYEKAMSTNQKSNNRGVTDITKNADNTISWSVSDVQILTLKAGTVSGTYAFYTGSNYLYSNGNNKNNYLRTGALADNASWTITVAATGVATIKSNGTNTNNWMRYNTSMLISCYGPSNTQKDMTEGLQCLDCGTILEEQVEIPAFGHTEGKTVEYILLEPTCTATGIKQVLVYCAVCEDELSNQDDVVIPALGHNYVDGVCDNCGEADPDAVQLFDIDVARMILGNALEFQFGVAQNKIPDTTGYVAVIEKTWADGTTTTKSIPAAEWGVAGQYWAIVYDGLAAKEMGDTFYVTIYNAEGLAVSNAREDSVRAYVERAYASQSATGKTMMVDMLNYGAAAQLHFGYGTSDLANNKLTAEQIASGTATVSTMENKQVKGDNYQGTRFILESRIQVQLAFRNMTTDMYAIYTYTNAAGKEQIVKVEGADFVMINGAPAGVELSALVYADARALVDVTLYNADGTVYGTATDSIESCALRSNADVFVYLMKFADSAKTHLYA